MDTELNYEQIISDATKRYRQIVDACVIGKDYGTIVSLTCDSLYSSEDTMPYIEKPPVLEEEFLFEYKGYHFELSSCTVLINKEQMLDVTDENFTQKFPRGVFTDRYVCWMWGHNDSTLYLVPGAWSCGAEYDLKCGKEVDKTILTAIDKFLETFNEEVHNV